MEKLKDLNEIKHRLIDWTKTETVKGFESTAEVEIMGEVIDMVKDLASAEKDCMEACYYELMAESMDGGESERMGYDRWRYSSGRFAPKGRGRVSGYLPPYMGDGEVLTAEPMGYADGRINGMRTNRAGNMRAGYTMDKMDGMEPREKMEKVIETMGDIWADADPETRKKMKTHVEDLLYQMEQN